MCCCLGLIVRVQGFSPENVENTSEQNIVNFLDVFVKSTNHTCIFADITLRGTMNGK